MNFIRISWIENSSGLAAIGLACKYPQKQGRHHCLLLHLLQITPRMNYRVWVIAFQDPQIWEERDRDPAIYIHRIATAPQFRGRALVKHLVQWAKVYAEKQQKKFVRLDTLGENTRLIAYYQEMGFDFLGIFPLKNTAGLPTHYHNTPACLFEIQL